MRKLVVVIETEDPEWIAAEASDIACWFEVRTDFNNACVWDEEEFLADVNEGDAFQSQAEPVVKKVLDRARAA